MATVSLRDDLDSYLSRSEKPPLSSKLKEQLGGWLQGVKYSALPSEEGGGAATGGWFTPASPRREGGCCPTLSRVQRIIAFGVCITLGVVFFSFAGFYLPFLLIKPRKFSLLFTLGSLFMIFSFSFLWGPVSHLKHLFSRDRVLFTSSYFATLTLTLYFAMVVQSTIFTVIFAVAQIIALIWFLVSYIPGGVSGLKFFTQVGTSAVSNSVSKALPV